MSEKTIYFPRFRCKECMGYLGEYERMYSHGTCPKCGWSGPHSRTICDTFKESWLKRELRPWWKFWAGPRWSYHISSRERYPWEKRGRAA